MLYRKLYREFYTDNDVHEWAMRYFKQWIKDIQIDDTQLKEDKLDKKNISYLLYVYTGNMNIPYNRFLRGFRNPEEDDEDYSNDISIIVKEISKFELQENIVVYRYTYKGLFKHMFKSLKAEVGKSFMDKGFVSTTLVSKLLKRFAKEHNCDCILKLYLPKGTKGAYVSFDKSILNEHEFLIPPNATFKLVRKYFSFKYWNIVYECELTHQ